MKRIILTTAALTVLLSAAGTASAQVGARAPNYGPGYRPLLSPWLDLANTGSGTNGGLLNPAIRYYNGTLTEFDRRANTAEFRSTFADIERSLSPGASMALDDALLRPLPATGHLTAFGNTGTYFGDPFRTAGGLTSFPTRR
jgi:hypothetical protein